MPVLDVKDLVKTYRMGKVSVPALRKVSLSVEKREFLAIFGPSGSGKSTLLHLIGGLDKPDEGEIVVDNSNILKMSDDKLAEFRLKKIGFVFQFFNLLPRLTALKNVQLPLDLADVPEKEASERAKNILSVVGLETRIYHRPFELSGGEQQRVAIARALINNPDIILADEPTGNLDTRIGGEIVDLMRRFNIEKEQTFLVITHDPDIAKNADRTIYLRDGSIERVEMTPRRKKE